MTNNKNNRPLWLIFLLVLILGSCCILCIPLLKYMSTPAFRSWLTQQVETLGPWGIIALFSIQVLQIIIAFLPGEPVELVAGAMYGAFGGLLICLAGILVGSFGIFTFVRKQGREVIEKTIYGKDLSKYAFVQNERKLETIVFLLYFIPGTPKDILIYVCALTDIPRRQFLFISTFARIPSVVSSTLAGATFASGNVSLTIGIFAITGLAGLIGIWIHGKILQHKNNKELLNPDPKNKNHILH